MVYTGQVTAWLLTVIYLVAHKPPIPPLCSQHLLVACSEVWGTTRISMLFVSVCRTTSLDLGL